MSLITSKTHTSRIVAGIGLLMFLYLLPYLLKLSYRGVFVISDFRSLLAYQAYSWVIPAIMILYAANEEKQNLILIPEEQYSIGWYLKSFFKIFLSLLLAALVIQLIIRGLGINQHSHKIDKLVGIFHRHPYMMVIVSLTAGVTEELMIRGYLFTRLLLLFKKPAVAIILSSLLFGLMHISYRTLANVLLPMMMGVAFSWHYYKYRNIKVLMMCHFVWDIVSLSLSSR